MASRGFTLIEVIVALAIMSMALIAGTQVNSALTRNSQRQTQTLLAQLCADNALKQLSLSAQMPSIGDSDLMCTQAGHNYRVALHVRTTPNPSFRRADAQVFDDATPILRVTTIVGRY
jgi:general secretion pathway protein I